MKNNKIYEDLAPLHKRARKTYILIAVAFVFLILFFWKIQIIDHQKFWVLSESNKMREITLPFPRGLITDRNGVILADNRASFSASFVRENCQDFDASCRSIAQLLDTELDVLKERIDKYRSFYQFRPFIIKDDLSLQEVARLESRKLERPELIIQTEPKRYYPFGNFAGHVLGYLQELTQQEMREGPNKEKRIGSLVGKTGIEKKYESLLKGKTGSVIEIVDSLGRKKGILQSIDPIPGHNIALTLDFDLQKKAEELLNGREGAIVVLKPQTGEILAMASYPNYDPNKFINRFASDEWQELMNRADFPLENRVIRGLYAPGSIFKIVMALGALDSKLISEWTTHFCGGSTVMYGHPFSCWFEPGHGNVNLYEAIRHSCNIYFYQLGKRMGIEKIAAYAKDLGFGSKTGVDIPGEKSGLVPDPQWKRDFRKAPWYPGETISVSIGQGPVLVTPLQVAAFTALVANRGRPIVPHFLKAENGQRQKSGSQESRLGNNPHFVEKKTFEKVIEGMWRGVNRDGTGRAAKVDGFDVCGKTGSTQVISRERAKKLSETRKEVKTHSWFTGFAPRNNPEVVVTMLVEHGGMGGTTAAPLAGNLFALYREKYDR
jgi:penicillin-binding protein 2